jgi:aerobic carbon-monoxide dehydrogenase large subunit
MNAIVDSLWRRYRIRHVDMPATPRRIWEAIANARKASN